MSNPLVDRILNNPLTFVSAKNQETEDQAAEVSSYIVLSSRTKQDVKPHTQAPINKKTKQKFTPKAMSLAETIAAYTGKKYKGKNERKLRKKELAVQMEPDSSDDTQYESASEFQTDSSFHGFKSSPDVGSEDSRLPSVAPDVHVEDRNGRDADSEDLGEAMTQTNSEEEHVESETGLSESYESEPISSVVESKQLESEQSLEPESPEKANQDEDSEDSSESESSSESHSEESRENSNEPQNEVQRFDQTLIETTQGLDADDSEDGDVEDEDVNSEEGSDDSDDDDEDSNDPDVGSDAEDAEEDADLENSLSGEQISQLKLDLLTEARQPLSQLDQKEEKATPPALPEVPPSPADLDDHYKIGEAPSDTDEASRIKTFWAKNLQGRKPVGLINFGVTCYMNSAIQTMLHIPAVQLYLMEVLANKHTQLAPRSVTHTLAELSSRMWGLLKEKHSGRKYVNPKKMVQRLDDINCMMSEWQQEDSHEYFMSLMSRLQEDSTPKGKKLNESVIYDIFGGLLEQEVICQKCKTVSITKQEFYDLSLGFNKRRFSNETSEDENVPKYSTERAIRDFFSLETIRVDPKDASTGYFCEKCQQKTHATKKSSVEKSPQTLLVHMKRFKFNGNSSLKVKQPIAYLKYLNLEKYSNSAAPMKYQLIGVIVHEGRSILSGHYVAHCLQPDGTWATYDDEYINKIDERSALSDPSAYCLVYTKLRPKSKKRPSSSQKTTKSTKRSKH